MDNVIEVAPNRSNLTGTGTIKTDRLMGVFVSQASATPTIKLADGRGTIANTFTPSAGVYYPLPTYITGTLTVTISGSVDCTVFYG